MNAPISSQEMRFLLTDTEIARKGAGMAADVRRQAAPPSLLRAIRQAFTLLTAWPSRRAAMNELAGLTDRELADIGLARHEIPQIVSHR